jgi:hypothetical protein
MKEKYSDASRDKRWEQQALHFPVKLQLYKKTDVDTTV